MSIDSQGNLYVGEASTGRRVQKFTLAAPVRHGRDEITAFGLTYAGAAVPKAVPAIRLSHTTNATTRTRTGSRSAAPEQLVDTGDQIASPETGLSYRVDRWLGQGGFGQVYLARRIGRSSAVPEQLCIKVSRRIDGWLREAYFGQLLDEHPRAIRVFDAFPLVQRRWRARSTASRSSTRGTAT